MPPTLPVSYPRRRSPVKTIIHTIGPHARDAIASPAGARPALDDAHLRRALGRETLERALSAQPREGPDRAVDRVRPAHPDALRPGPRARQGRSRQGRRLDRPRRGHGDAARSDPARPDEHVDDDQRNRRLAPRAVRRGRREARGRRKRAPGHDSERHPQGVPEPRDLRLPARPEHAADRRHDRLHGAEHPQVEPDQHLLLPPPGGGGDARAGERVPSELMGSVFGRISFFVNAGVRFIEEHAKLRAMAVLWDELGRERYGVDDEKHRRLRYGVQVNSLGLTEAQPENNVYRIALEALAVTLGRDTRARAVQLPAWNEALGLPRPWDQQWSLRLQQILAYETDLLEYPDIFEGSIVMEGLVAELVEGAREEMGRVAELGGAVKAVDYMKSALVESHRKRWGRIEDGQLTVVGMNRFQSTEPSPLTADADGGILVVDPQVEAEQRAALETWRSERDGAAVEAALEELARVARDDSENIMPATIAAARAGATTGEWSPAL